MGICSTLWDKARGWLDLKEEFIDKEISNEEILDEAHQKLIEARNIFSNVNNPEMIDYAVYNLKAAEKRYNYLIKIMKNGHCTRGLF